MLVTIFKQIFFFTDVLFVKNFLNKFELLCF